MGSKIVVLFGWPCSGKSSVASELLKLMPMHLVDSDGTRTYALGGHDTNWHTSADAAEKNRQQMALVYDIIHTVAGAHARMGRDLMITAPYTRPSSWEFLSKALQGTDASLKAIWCRPGEKADDADFIKEILAKRLRNGYTGGSQTYEQYRMSRDQFVTPTVPHLMVETLTAQPTEAAQSAHRFITL